MPISDSFRRSAKRFCKKYACYFSLREFESDVERYMLQISGEGFCDFYKTMFERLYKKALENVAQEDDGDLDGEAMLDDFEYTVIRPYVSQSGKGIDHKPYAGMDRLTRLMYLDKITRNAPSNLVELYTEKYRSGELSIDQMSRRVSETLSFNRARREHYVDAAAFILALERANESRSLLWRVLHPAKNSTERKSAGLLKKQFICEVEGGDGFYNEMAKCARYTFAGHRRVNENLVQSMINARDEAKREQKMNDALIGSFR